MSLCPVRIGEVPEQTVAVARAAFPAGSLAIRIRDELGALFTDGDFAPVYPRRGRPALSPAVLALVSVLQFSEGLSDRQATHAVRARIDWKYALGLELTDPGFDHSVLSEFRDRLIDGGAGQRMLDAVLQAATGAGLLKAGGRARTDSTHVLAATRALHRLENCAETLRAALNALAAAAPDWLRGTAAPEWFDRYGTRAEHARLPKNKAARIELAETTGVDGMALLTAVRSPGAPVWLRDLPAVEVLRQTWVQQYQLNDGRLRWRANTELPPGRLLIVSPYDPDSRYGVKRQTYWDGYKVHLTETCEPHTPHLITHIETTSATTQDVEATGPVHAGLARRNLLPDVHLVDAGYTSAGHLVTAHRAYGIELLGPVRGDTGWQKTTNDESGFTLDDFTVDWDNQQVTCPNGATDNGWINDRSQAGLPVIRVRFPARICRPCPDKNRCTRGTQRGRQLTLRARAEHEALQHARTAQKTGEWKQRYALRAGVEGTISQAVRGFGMRRSRYRGQPKTHLQHLLTATAINLARIDAWLSGTPHAPTRTSHFAALRPAA